MQKYLENLLSSEDANLVLWYFVTYIFGIIFYLNNPIEWSNQTFLLLSILCGLSILIFNITNKITLKFLILVLVSFFLGIIAVKIRILLLNKPTAIDMPGIYNVIGKVKQIKPAKRGMQLLLGDLWITESADKIPNRIRINIPYKHFKKIFAGDLVNFTAALFPPRNQLTPQAYSLFLSSYFEQIGASGYTISPIIVLAKPNYTTQTLLGKLNNLVEQTRRNIYNRLLEILGPKYGNFAAALIIGEIGGIPNDILTNMRTSGISHILCVSGLHLSLVSGMIFCSCRFLLNISDYVAFNFNIKNIAGYLSIIGSFIYLHISGSNIAATRAFIMTTIIIIAFLIGRSTISLRSLAAAACCILSINPENIMKPTFQLSFMAVLSLIVNYQLLLNYQTNTAKNEHNFFLHKIKSYVAASLSSSTMVNFITAPILLYSFHILPNYSALANLVAVPITSFLVMPLIIISSILMPFGLDFYPLQLVKYGIIAIINCATIVANIPGSTWYFGSITGINLMIYLLGLFWCIIWSRGKIYGLGIIILSLILMISANKPSFMLYPQSQALAINIKNELHIFGKDLNSFLLRSWATWFGQRDILYYNININDLTPDVESQNLSILNQLGICKYYSIEDQFNFENKQVDEGKLEDYRCLIKTKQFLENHAVSSNLILTFCKNHTNCKTNQEQNTRFSFN